MIKDCITLVDTTIARNEATPKSIVIPQLPILIIKKKTSTVPKRTNSVRGKEFRAKRKQYESTLVDTVHALRAEVQDLQLLRSIRQQRAFQTRSNIQGSLVRLVQEYFSLFQCGVSMDSAANNTMVATQESFLRCAMHEDLDFGGIQCGVDALMDQWRRYASYHSKFRINVVRIDIDGADENPVVTVESDLRVQFSHKTFQYVFPHVAENSEFVNKYMGLEVTYRGVNKFRFTKDGRIIVYDSEVGFVDAFLKAGMNLSDVGTLIQQALITDEFLLGDDPSSGNSPCCSPSDPDDDPKGEEELDEGDIVEILESNQLKRSHQLDIEYLLS